MFMHFSSPGGLENVVSGRLVQFASRNDLRRRQEIAADRRFAFQHANARAALPSFGRSQCTSPDTPRSWAVLPDGI